MQWFTVALTWLSGVSQLSHWSPYNQYLPPGSQQATVFALIYGYPLSAYTTLSLEIANPTGEFITNTFYHQTELAMHANFTSIVRPNMDTLYSEALVDLSTNDLVVTIPTVPSGRFYVFPFYDLYGNNFANLGTVANSTPGRYLVGYRASDPGCSPGDDQYDGYIYMPTPYGAIMLRIQVDNSSDAQAVNDIQVVFKLELETNGISRPRVAPTLTKSLLLDGFSNDPTIKLLQLTAHLSLYNPPEVMRDASWVNSTLSLAGLTNGSYNPPSGINLSSATEEATSVVSNVLCKHTSKNFRDLGNNWSQLRAHLSGDFKSHYVVRAFVTVQGYLQLTADQAVYPAFNVSAQLFANTTYNITFHGKPQVDGFWSLTVYNDTGYLVENPLGRYSLGDRSAIRYHNGSLVYGPKGSPSNSTAPFSLFLQTQDITPHVKYCSNWLPTPSRNQTFNINLRWYGMTTDLKRLYKYPSVEVIDNLVGTHACPRATGGLQSD